jgi:hypothetical protein
MTSEGSPITQEGGSARGLSSSPESRKEMLPHVQSLVFVAARMQAPGFQNTVFSGPEWGPLKNVPAVDPQGGQVRANERSHLSAGVAANRRRLRPGRKKGLGAPG